MKRFLSITLSLVFVVTAFAQQKDVTKFLGIPVDGTKAEMIEKLKAKGFTINPYVNDVLDGEFNGTEVHISIVTNNNKVWRIGLCDANTMDETNIIIRFNRLLRQFEANPRYRSLGNQEIPASEDIGHEMLANHKVYEASFIQRPDTAIINRRVKAALLEKYTEEQLKNPTEDIDNDEISLRWMEITSSTLNKTVWFKIDEVGTRYRIFMLYDNKLNQANGEDL